MQPPPCRCRTVPEKHVRRRRKKRKNRSPSQSEEVSPEPELKREEDNNTTSSGPEAVQCLRYNSMLYMGFIGDSEVVIVEQPWLDIVATFPDALHRKIYGT